MNEQVNHRLRNILKIHFDPDQGTPYWLERQQALGLVALRDIQCTNDLARLGPMEETALAERPVEDFIPRCYAQCRDIILAQTGGSLGRPKFAVHRLDEFETAFISPFLRAAEACAFPRACHWLFIGPTGPHVIGRAAQACARAYGRGDVYTVDFDPRWAKKLVSGSFSANRYLEHILDQALHILNTQTIEVLFSTPAVLTRLCDRLSANQRAAIRGIHLGGMTVECEFMTNLSEAFPQAVVLSGLGNTLLGMAPQLAYAPDTGMDYFIFGERLKARIVPEDKSGLDLTQTVDYGQRGRLVWHRLDEMQLLINLVERDTAIRIEPSQVEGFTGDGLRDPRPVVNQTLKPALGLY
jgi:thienamycin biosynthesis protein ThnN